ncbi:hypothetical protein IQ268_12195 [Oculatella sp. LEGE 06141]|nr:hypothetical protein [Oculatella sp. LEGE 06141]
MPGYLREGVDVAFSDDKVKITYALWEVTLPSVWVFSQPTVQGLLERTSTLTEVVSNPQTAAFTRLLEAQGCFTPLRKPSYTLSEIRELFAPLRSSWYAIYYAHPIWERLRSGSATRNELIAWLIHNYHTSRTAGVVAARMVSIGKSAQWKQFFQQDALDEYWHCDAFYFIDAPALRVSSQSVKTYVPLPSSTAFEQHTLRLAECDSLGHLLTAYFQESSIAFEQDSNHFYQDVEASYEIPSFFQRWKQHIRIDIEQGHAEGLGNLLESNAIIDELSLESALRNAWLSFFFLLASLDDIYQERHNASEILLRLPITDGLFEPEKTALLRENYFSKPTTASIFDNLQSLYLWYTRECSTLNFYVKCVRPDTDLEYLRDGLSSASFRALGFARSHDEILVCGRSAKLFSTITTTSINSLPENPWSIAIVNYILEMTVSPTLWLLCVSLLLDRIRSHCQSSSQMSWSPDQLLFLDEFRSTIWLSPKESDYSITTLLQFDELIKRWMTTQDAIPPDILA